MNALQNGLLSGSLTSELLSAHADRALALAFHKPVGIYNRKDGVTPGSSQPPPRAMQTLTTASARSRRAEA